jgi:transposase
MITIGVDAHKRVHMAVAVDGLGRTLGEWRGSNSREGWGELRAWLVEVGEERLVGVEGSGSYGRGLAQYLVGQGERVYEVNSRWTALGRRVARSTAKSDRLDALAVALVVQREGEGLPAVVADDETSVLAHLAEEREAVMAEATRVRNRLHAVLGQLDPEYEKKLPRLTSKAAVAALEVYAVEGADGVAAVQAASVRRLAARLASLVAESAALEQEINERAEKYAALTAICGVSLLTAGTLAGILGKRAAMGSDAQLAAYAGVAPLEASSGERTRHRLSRSGDRRLNAIIYRIAVVQLRHSEQARTYVARRTAEGKTKREAIRALKRYIVRAVWRAWRDCLQPPPAPQTTYGCL